MLVTPGTLRVKQQYPRDIAPLLPNSLYYAARQTPSSLFFFLVCRAKGGRHANDHVASHGFAARCQRACTPLPKSEEKERYAVQYFEFFCSVNHLAVPLKKHKISTKKWNTSRGRVCMSLCVFCPGQQVLAFLTKYFMTCACVMNFFSGGSLLRY